MVTTRRTVAVGFAVVGLALLLGGIVVVRRRVAATITPEASP